MSDVQDQDPADVSRVHSDHSFPLKANASAKMAGLGRTAKIGDLNVIPDAKSAMVRRIQTVYNAFKTQ